LSVASFASSTRPDISKCIMHFIEDKELSLLQEHFSVVVVCIVAT
jgi:hypothetical protein